MPEGPDIYLAKEFINSICKGKFFNEIRKSAVSKNPEIFWPLGTEFSISAQSRGKELLLNLAPNGNETFLKTEKVEDGPSLGPEKVEDGPQKVESKSSDGMDPIWERKGRKQIIGWKWTQFGTRKGRR